MQTGEIVLFGDVIGVALDSQTIKSYDPLKEFHLRDTSKVTSVIKPYALARLFYDKLVKKVNHG